MRGLLLAVGLTALAGLAAVVFVVVSVGAPGGERWVDLETGTCFDLAGAVEAADGDPLVRVETLRCSEPHDAQVVATGRLDPEGDSEYPSDDELFVVVDRQCDRLVGDRLDEAVYGLLPIAPDERTWNERNGRFACVAVVLGGRTVATSALD